VRVYIVPRLWKVNAERLTVSIRNGYKLVEHFGERPRQSSPAGASARKMKRRGSRTR
jgi:hypothetical protein